MTFIKHSFISLITIIVLYFSIICLLKKIPYKGKPAIFVTNNYYNWKGGDTYEKFKEFNKNQSHDILFIGSSRAYRGYSPFLFNSAGFQSFNLGTSAQSIKNTYFIIKHYLNSSNCKVLVVDVFAGAFTKNQLESSSDLIENIESTSAAYDIAIHNDDIRTLNIASFRYLTEDDKPYFKKTDYIGKGYSVNRDSMSKQKQIIFFENKPISHKNIEIDEEQLEYFNRILELCKERDIQLVVVYSPVSYFYNYSIHQKFVNKLNASIEKSKTHFYDFSKCDSINTAFHFYDDSHLNQAGVEIFNRQLLNQLLKDKIILKK